MPIDATGEDCIEKGLDLMLHSAEHGAPQFPARQCCTPFPIGTRAARPARVEFYHEKARRAEPISIRPQPTHRTRQRRAACDCHSTPILLALPPPLLPALLNTRWFISSSRPQPLDLHASQSASSNTASGFLCCSLVSIRHALSASRSFSLPPIACSLSTTEPLRHDALIHQVL